MADLFHQLSSVLNPGAQAAVPLLPDPHNAGAGLIQSR